MHTLQPKHTKLKPDEVDKLTKKYNIVLVQLPKISIKDSALVGDFKTGDVVKIERTEDTYYRVVI